MSFRLIAYVRVSTFGQRHNTSFSTQEAAIKHFCALKGHTIVKVVQEQKSASGRLERPKFHLVLEEIKEGKADGLLVYSLDRFARSALQGLEIARQLHSSGKQLLIVDVALDTTSSIGQMMLTVLLAFAEFERNMISERVQAGIARTKALCGYVSGKPPYGWCTARVNGRKGLRQIPEQQAVISTIKQMQAEGIG